MKSLVILFIAMFVGSLLSYGQKRVLFIGDSITDGNWGNPNNAGQRNYDDWNHIFGHGYAEMCAAYYMSEYADQKPVFFNRGISGNTVNDLKSRWEKDCLDLNPDVLSVLVGINDIICSEDGKVDTLAFHDTLKDLLSQTKAKNPNIKIILGEPFCEEGFRVDTEGKVRATCEALARQVKAIAQEFDAIYIPYQSMFDALCKDDTKYWIWDGVHPTPAGHWKMSQMWREAVKLY